MGRAAKVGWYKGVSEGRLVGGGWEVSEGIGTWGWGGQ